MSMSRRDIAMVDTMGDIMGQRVCALRHDGSRAARPAAQITMGDIATGRRACAPSREGCHVARLAACPAVADDQSQTQRVFHSLREAEILMESWRRHDNAIRRMFLESVLPPGTFANASLSGLPDRVVDGRPFHFSATGDLTVRIPARLPGGDTGE